MQLTKKVIAEQRNKRNEYRRYSYCIFLKLIVLFIQAGISGTAIGQTRNYVYYSTQNGLPSNVIYDIQEDRTGFIWIATDQGVSRFDGKNFVNFTSRDGLNDNDVFRICEDKEGRIWFFTFKTEPCYYYRGKIFNQTSDNRIVKNDNNAILTFSLNPIDKTLYFMERTGKKQGKMVDFYNPENYFYLGELSAPNTIFSHFRIGKQLYLTHRENSPHIYKIKGHQLVKAATDQRFYGFKCFTGNSVMAVYNREKSRVYRFDIRDERFRLLDSINLKNSYTSVAVQQGQLYGLSEREGFFKLATGQERIVENSEMKEKIWGGLIDRNKNIWYYASASGLYLFPRNSFVYYNKQNCSSLPENRCLSIAQLNGKVYVGFENAGVRLLSNGLFEEVDINLNSGRKARILKMITNGDEVLAGGDDILFRLFSTSRSEPIALKDRHAVKDIERTGNQLVLATHASFLVIQDNFRRVEQSVKTRFTSALITQQGDVLLGKLKGLAVFRNGQYEDNLKVHPLLDEARISDIKQDAAGRIWIATYSNGLFITDFKKTIHLDAFSNQNNELFISGTICKDLFIHQGEVWLSTNRGINRIELQNFSESKFAITRYTRGIGLPAEDINALVVKGSMVYAATSDGLVTFDYRKIEPSPVPIIVLNSLYINLRDSILPTNAHLRSDLNNISFALSGIAYTGGEPITFKYRLVGLQNEWTYTQTDRVDFVGLPPGKYRFESKAISSDYRQSSNAVQFDFVIDPPFYKTWWFYILGVFSIALLLIFLFRNRINQARENDRINTQIMELKLQALRAQMNPHFIFNALTSIQYFFSIHEERKANTYMSSFASLIRQTLNATRKNFTSLSEEVELLEKYIGLEVLRLDKPTAYSIDLGDNIDRETVQIPSMFLQPLVENALIHGVRHSPEATGRLHILFSAVGPNLQITIQDNGPGITKGEKSKQSAGLDITRQRIETINQIYRLGLSMKIEDLSDGNAPETGTLVSITMKTIHAL